MINNEEERALFKKNKLPVDHPRAKFYAAENLFSVALSRHLKSACDIVFLTSRLSFQSFSASPARFAFVCFRPCDTVFFATPLVSCVETIIFSSQRYPCPWSVAFLKKREHVGEPFPVIEVMKETSNRNFDAKMKMQKASSDFKNLSMLSAMENYDHGKKKHVKGYFTCRLNGNDSQVVSTPKWLYDKLHEVFRFDHDPCPINAQTDAMCTDWGLMNFVNPPWRHTAAFAFRAVEEARKSGSRSVILCPALPDLRWRRELQATGCVHGVVFLRTGVAFDGYKTPLSVSLNLILIGGESRQETVAFFCDVLPDKRRKPTVASCAWPPDLGKIGWQKISALQ